MRKTFIVLLFLLLLFTFAIPVAADNTIRIFYAGPEQSGIHTALTLAPKGTFTFVKDASKADVFLLNGVIPDPDLIAARLKAGAGLVLFLGPDMSAADVTNLIGIPLTFTEKNDAVSLVQADVEDPLVKQILWNSAPQVRDRIEVNTPISYVQPLVTAYEDGAWILWSANNSRTFVFNAFLNESVDFEAGKNATFNPQIQDWAYFNYLVYHLVERASGNAPLSFADYPASPVPHASDRNVLLVAMALIIGTTFAIFFLVRRYSLRHPEELDRIVLDRTKFQVHEEHSAWENVGFHRPLSGFLIALSIGLVFFIPMIIYQNLILPTYILPSAQALGIWGRVTQFFNLAWLFFDMGTSVAFIKFLSEYRVSDPRKGIQFGQVYIWWQALSGAIQVALVIALASTLAPKSAYALYAWSVIIHSFIQIPGFYQVMKHSLTGLQRLDFSRVLEIGANAIVPFVVQPVVVTLMFLWGKSHPIFGGSMGGLLGLGMAAYVSELSIFVVGYWFYQRVGLTPASFSWPISIGISLRPASNSVFLKCSVLPPGRSARPWKLPSPRPA